MHLCVQPAEFGWQASDVESLDADSDGQYGQYAWGNTRKEALEALREIYEERLEFPDDLEERPEASQAIAWIDSLLLEEQPKPKNDELFELAKDICGVGR